MVPPGSLFSCYLISPKRTESQEHIRLLTTVLTDRRCARLSLLLALILAMLGLPLLVSAQDEISPGITVDRTYSGEPLSLTINLQSGQLLTVLTESNDLNIRLDLEQDGSRRVGGRYLSSTERRLIYLAQTDGNFDVVVDAGRDDRGSLTLRADIIDVTVAAIGETITLPPPPIVGETVFAAFEADAGSIINLSAMTMSDGEDLEIALYDVDSNVIDWDDDDGPGRNPLMRRVPLAETGVYLVAIDRSRVTAGMLQPVELTIEPTDRLYLSADPQLLTLGNDLDQIGTEVYTIAAEAGNTYRVTVTIEPIMDLVDGVTLTITGSDRTQLPELEASHTTRVTWDFRANEDATWQLHVHPILDARDTRFINYTIALETVSE